MLDRQRPAVHGDRQHRVAVVGERRRAACRRSSRPRRSAARVGVGADAASASRSASRTPLHQALPIRSPPTGLDTQLRVIQASVSRRSMQVLGRSAPARGRPCRGSAAATPRARSRAARSRCGSGRSRRPASATTRCRSSPTSAPAATCGSRDAGQPQQPPALLHVAAAARRPARPAPPSPSAHADARRRTEQEAPRPLAATPAPGRSASASRSGAVSTRGQQPAR